ncbi:MAG: hypothetical protein ACLVGL_05835 [Waltera sp.]
MYLNQKIKYTSRKTTREKLMTYLTDQAKIEEEPTILPSLSTGRNWRIISG